MSNVARIQQSGIVCGVRPVCKTRSSQRGPPASASPREDSVLAVEGCSTSMRDIARVPSVVRVGEKRSLAARREGNAVVVCSPRCPFGPIVPSMHSNGRSMASGMCGHSTTSGFCGCAGSWSCWRGRHGLRAGWGAGGAHGARRRHTRGDQTRTGLPGAFLGALGTSAVQVVIS